jgi:hypothetical protein
MRGRLGEEETGRLGEREPERRGKGRLGDIRLKVEG